MAKIVLRLIKPERYFGDVLKILKKNKSSSIVYVTTSKPYETLVSTFAKKGINLNKILFIDCISQQLKEKTKNADNCVFINSPQNLTAISIAVNEAIRSISGKRMLFFDSLSILLIYNDAITLGKFSNFILNKMRASDVDMILLALESDTSKDIIKQIETIADVVEGGKR